MLTSSQLLKDVFFCPEESNFYAHCLETLVFNRCLNPETIVEFGSGDGSPVMKSLLRTEFDGTIHGFELNPLACQVATSRIKEYQLGKRYMINNRCLFESAKPQADYLVSNPPYLPAPDNQLYQPLLHGGIEGITITKKLLSLNYSNVLVLAASYSNPVGLIDYALTSGYVVADFAILPIGFGYYSSEPKVKAQIEALRQKGMAFYSENIYLLAGVLFTKQTTSKDDMSNELVKVMTSL
jgi:methylase of polypeptide subunit release factors